MTQPFPQNQLSHLTRFLHDKLHKNHMTQQLSNINLRMRIQQSKSLGMGEDSERMATPLEPAPETIPTTKPKVASRLVIKIMYPSVCTVLDSNLDDILKDLHKVSYTSMFYTLPYCLSFYLRSICKSIIPSPSKPPARYRLTMGFGNLP